MIAIAEL